ncbi:hypothetical protein PsalMR5_04066 [Piscirickettsia salmonis]|nr:hypothetical protein [Piscirickettsia salmonis]QGP56575.1 hypothetical protein PsalSR1_04064 [Piscirickettsia salmonis]QGP61383.1 hypothetical protein PsalBI1_04025 [Piscirickettsia salmonis]QGP66141.1 hypothetical protein PsalMR5_04066 [Piscirickettsia salmonis]
MQVEELYSDIQSYQITQAIYTAARLDIASYIGDEGKTVEQISQKFNVRPQLIYRLLRALITKMIFIEKAGKFYNNGKSSFLILKNLKVSAGSMDHFLVKQNLRDLT